MKKTLPGGEKASPEGNLESDSSPARFWIGKPVNLFHPSIRKKMFNQVDPSARKDRDITPPGEVHFVKALIGKGQLSVTPLEVRKENGRLRIGCCGDRPETGPPAVNGPLI